MFGNKNNAVVLNKNTGQFVSDYNPTLSGQINTIETERIGSILVMWNKQARFLVERLNDINGGNYKVKHLSRKQMSEHEKWREIDLKLDQKERDIIHEILQIMNDLTTMKR